MKFTDITKDICVAVMYSNAASSAYEKIDDIACAIYRNAKG